jgi:hypothetical protein
MATDTHWDDWRHPNLQGRIHLSPSVYTVSFIGRLSKLRCQEDLVSRDAAVHGQTAQRWRDTGQGLDIAGLAPLRHEAAHRRLEGSESKPISFCPSLETGWWHTRATVFLCLCLCSLQRHRSDSFRRQFLCLDNKMIFRLNPSEPGQAGGLKSLKRSSYYCVWVVAEV